MEMTRKQKTARKWVVVFACLSPLIIVTELWSFSFIMEMIRAQSDMAVLIGTTSIGIFLMVNYFLTKLIINKTKNA